MKSTHFPLASVMTEMKPLMEVSPSGEMTPQREAYDKAFALAYQHSGGRDLVEEMVALNCWPLGKSRPSFKIEMVNIPIYGPAEGLLLPDLGLSCRRVRVRKTLCLLWRKVHGRSSVTSLIENFSHGGPSGARCLV